MPPVTNGLRAEVDFDFWQWWIDEPHHWQYGPADPVTHVAREAFHRGRGAGTTPIGPTEPTPSAGEWYDLAEDVLAKIRHEPLTRGQQHEQLRRLVSFAFAGMVQAARR